MGAFVFASFASSGSSKKLHGEINEAQLGFRGLLRKAASSIIVHNAAHLLVLWERRAPAKPWRWTELGRGVPSPGRGRTSLVHALPPSCMPAPPSCIDSAQRFHRRAQIKVYSSLERLFERFEFRVKTGK